MGGGTMIAHMRYWRFLMVLALMLVVGSLWAHPHMWIDTSLDFEFSSRGLSGIRVTWRFDDFNSADLRARFDLNDNGTIDPAEEEAIYEGAFSHLGEVNYFMLANVGGEAQELPAAIDFSAFVDEGKLVYEFVVPLELRFSRFNNMVLAFFDISYFIDFVTKAGQESYFTSGRTVTVEQQSMRLSTQGWGEVPINAIRAIVL